MIASNIRMIRKFKGRTTCTGENKQGGGKRGRSLKVKRRQTHPCRQWLPNNLCDYAVGNIFKKLWSKVIASSRLNDVIYCRSTVHQHFHTCIIYPENCEKKCQL